MMLCNDIRYYTVFAYNSYCYNEGESLGEAVISCAMDVGPIYDFYETKDGAFEIWVKDNTDTICLINFISSLGMGNRLDPSKLMITTLDKTHDDPLAKKIRNELKKSGVNLKQIPVVTSSEIPLKNKSEITSMIFVPSAAGLLLANYVINKIIKGE